MGKRWRKFQREVEWTERRVEEYRYSKDDKIKMKNESHQTNTDTSYHTTLIHRHYIPHTRHPTPKYHTTHPHNAHLQHTNTHTHCTPTQHTTLTQHTTHTPTVHPHNTFLRQDTLTTHPLLTLLHPHSTPHSTPHTTYLECLRVRQLRQTPLCRPAERDSQAGIRSKVR
jgi:hypothetical protein